MLILCQSHPPTHDTTATSQTTATRSTGYPMPALNPGALRGSGGQGPAGTAGGQVPIGALATAAAASPRPSSPTGNLVTLTAGQRQIPAPVLAAYRKAATTLAGEQPACHLRWQLLAGIGKVESGNAQGRQISPDGTVTPSILGPRLTGTSGFARILDTDHGTLDADTTYDRAVGPMQFLPSTWAGAGRDGNADGHKDPNNIYDAGLTAAGYLCTHHRDLTDPAQLSTAIRAYNPSDAYVRAVLAWTTGYTATTPAPIAVPTPTRTSPDDASTSDPYPIFALTPVHTLATPLLSPTATNCASITLTTSSLKAVITTTTLDLTGRYTNPGLSPAHDATITIHTIARDVTGHALADTDLPLPLKPGDVPALLTRLPLDQLTDPGHTTTLTLTLTTTPPGCPGRALTTITITNVIRPASTSAPAATIASSRPTPSPTTTQ
ncbi:lytic murein transglycosylase [Pseudofrankia sp. DC12]|uniref:lytic transglycosylase domain-containing protein n=1 Tax=Pseudofrankia sp. DC12 TaxID=683315 RepID=UPI000695EE83|nr:lytic murein transglycosylase [Pseudofrankia sp. DC12]